MSTSDNDHLAVTKSDRGFSHMPPISETYGGEVRVYESSAAAGPHLWLRVTEPTDAGSSGDETVEASAHLRLDDAIKLAEQILHLVRNHYQLR